MCTVHTNNGNGSICIFAGLSVAILSFLANAHTCMFVLARHEITDLCICTRSFSNLTQSCSFLTKVRIL